MKAFAPTFSMTCIAAAIGAAMAAPGPSAWARTVVTASASLPDEIAGASAHAGGFPKFCQVPPRPLNVRIASSFKNAVVSLRLSGVRLVAETAPGTFSLEDADGFASAARASATAPPPMTPPYGQQTETFTDQARALARPPGPR